MKLQTKFNLISGIASILVFALVTVSVVVARQNREQISLLDVIQNVTQRHMEADMMHDAIRADVLAAVVSKYNNDARGAKAAMADLKEHYARFKEQVILNKQEKLPKDIVASMDKMLPALRDYMRSAAVVIQAAQGGDDLSKPLSNFSKQFSIMEAEYDKVSEEIDNWSEEVKKISVQTEELGSRLCIVFSILAMLSVAAVPLYAWKGLFVPIVLSIEQMGKLAKGDYHVDLTEVNRQDEVGAISSALIVFKENTIERLRLEEKQKNAEALSREEKKQAMHELAKRFEDRVQGIIQTVAAASTQLYQTSESMSGVIHSTSQKADGVSKATGETSQGVQGVASAAEEMSATVREIAQQITKSVSSVQAAVEQVTKADETSAQLDAATQKIGQIVDVIQAIAGQINLLALNATIESARTGEAGKGFAVVAGEVKNLANQTSKATDEIAGNINSIQQVSHQVIGALRSIKDTIAGVAEISSVISAAVEEQSATTNEIAANMNNAARGITQINDDIGEVSKLSTEASFSATQTLDAAKLLSKESETLRAEVIAFLSDIRSD